MATKSINPQELELEPVGEFIPSDLLDLPAEEYPLELTLSPWRVEYAQTDTSEEFRITPVGLTLGSFTLLQLLDRVAPYKGQSSFAVLNDWRILDPSASKSPDQEQQPRAIIAMHTPLGRPWGEFVASKRAFIDTLADGDQPHIPYSMETTLVSASREQDLGELELLHIIVGGDEEEKADIFAAFKGAGTDLEQAIILATHKFTQGRRKERIYAPHKNQMLKNRFRMLSRDDQATVLGRALQSSVANENMEDIQNIVHELFARRYEVVVLDDGSRWVFDRQQAEAEDTFTDFEQIKERQFAYTDGAYAAVYGLRKSYNGKMQLVCNWSSIKQTKKPTGRTSVIPVARWTKTPEGRTCTIERDFDGDKTYIDGIVGLLALGGMAPLPSSFPETQSITKRGEPVRTASVFYSSANEQEIGAAQIPVMALMQPGRILNSPFVELIEDRARTMAKASRFIS